MLQFGTRMVQQIYLRSLYMKRDTYLVATGLSLAILVVTQGGCAGPAKVSGTAQPAQAAIEAQPLTGKVVETMDAGGYTYIALEKDGKKTWVAVPAMKVAVGDEVKLLPGMEMTNFPSKSLNRTFEKIIFSGGPATQAAPQPASLPSGHPAVGKEAPMPAAKEAQPAKMILAGKVVETMDAGGYTYMCLEKEGKKGWVAVPVTQVKVGDEVEIQPGMSMGKFTSKTLNRTFDDIVFSSGVVPKK